MSGVSAVFLAGILAVCAIVSAAAIAGTMPLLQRYAMARPNARSSHREPVPQGAGGPMLAVAVCAFIFAAAAGAITPMPFHFVLMAAAAAMAVLGAVDDIQPLSAKVRLVLQCVLVSAVLLAAPEDWRLVPILPLAVERIVAVVAGVWFVNLTNFMDGIDGLTIAEMTPVSVALSGMAVMGLISPASGLLAAALAGVLLGFLVFNRPPARVFLGDVGSLPAGLLVAALLFELAARTSVVPALILPLYYLYDATQTLLMRIANSENVFEAHRRHAYQNAVDGGWSAARVDLCVLALNAVLAGLALVALVSGPIGQVVALGLALASTVMVCRRFRQGMT